MKKDTKNYILKNLQSLKYMGFSYLDPIKFNVDTSKEYDLPNDLETLKDLVKNCNLCSFSKTKKNIIFGEGNKNADLLFLNSAPTQMEDETGNILSGNSGDMLIKMCQNVLNLSIKDIYVANVLKCFPLKEINDCKSEINICKPYIQKQIDIIKPKIIVAFGDSFKYLTNETEQLENLRGNMYDYNGIKVIFTFHPSFILRNPSLKKEVLYDLQKIKLLMESH